MIASLIKKHSLLLLLILFASCKNQTTTTITPNTPTESNSDNNTNQSALDMWTTFVASNPEFKDASVPEADFFHDNKADANRLAILTKNGIKQASSGLYSLYQHYNVALPKVGNTQIITDFDGNAQAIIQTTHVDTIRFKNITKSYAQLDMATTVDPLKTWKKAHWDFFTTILKDNNQKPTQDMLVVCETFKTIWPIK